jgi:hypothetical protein
MVELAAIVMAAIGIARRSDEAIVGILATVAASIIAWQHVQQFGQLSSSYFIASVELTAIRLELDTCDSLQWAEMVDKAEEAVSREHRLWRSTRL